MRSHKLLTAGLNGAAWLSLGLLTLIGLFILLKSWPFISSVGLQALWQDSRWAPTEGLYNLVPMLAGSLLVSLGAVILAAPLGVLLAIFGNYYAPAGLGAGYRALMELLAGIPSVVYGFWGLIVLVPWINQWVPPGASLLAGCLVLALMILPLVMLVTDNSFKQTPKTWLAAADALAIQRWSQIQRLVLPHAMPSIIAGTVLQSGRALGETMAVLMVCGNVVQLPTSLFEPVRTLTANIALEMAYASEPHTQALFSGGLLLFGTSLVLVLLSYRLKGRG